MPATPLLKVTVNDQIKDGIILYKGFDYDIPYGSLISVSDLRNQQFNTSIDAQQWTPLVDNVFLIKGNNLPNGLTSRQIGFTEITLVNSNGNSSYTAVNGIDRSDSLFEMQTALTEYGTHLCGAPATNGVYDVIFRVLGITTDWRITASSNVDRSISPLYLGDAFFTLKIIVQDFPTSAPTTTTPTTPTTPPSPVFGEATTGSATSEVELHVIPITTSILTSSSRSITVPFTTTRIATTSAPTQNFMVKFGGVNLMDVAFATTSNTATSCVISAKISKTSSSIFKFDILIDSSIGGVQQQSITRTKSVPIASFSNSNLSFHATNAAGSSAPIISNVGNIINV